MKRKELTKMFKEKPFEKICAIDIETASDGRVLDIGFYTIVTDNGKPHYAEYLIFSNWKTFFDMLLLEKGAVRVIAHNGFGFDFITFNQWFLEHYKEYGITDDDVTYLSSESLMVAMIIRFKKLHITLCDTIRFFPGQSLEKLGQSFLGRGKDDVPDDYINRMEDFKKEFPDKYYAYLENDCQLLYEIYCKFREEINFFVKIGELGLSAGSTSMRSFRRWLADINSKIKIFSCPDEFDSIADAAMRGGLTLYIGNDSHKEHLYKNVNHYDVVSMYPSVMRFIPVPTKPLRYTDKIEKEFDCYVPGWYLCDFKQLDGKVPILFPIGSQFPQWEGQAVLNHFELQFLDLYGKYQVVDGVIYDEFRYPFEKFFDSLLRHRMFAKESGQEAKSHSLKILMNSLYGKFAQRASREIIAITSDKDWYAEIIEANLRDFNDTGVTEYKVTNDYVLYGVESQATSFSNRLIGAMVTSLSRLKLGMIYNTYPTIYCDTDSIFTRELMHDFFTGNEPGMFELSKDSPQDMICLGKKAYQYGDDLKFKGVPAKNISEDQLQLMRYGGSVEVEYRAPAAWKTAMKNNMKNPNQFLPHVRRVQRGKSLAEMGMLHSRGKYFKADDVKEFLDNLLTIL